MGSRRISPKYTQGNGNNFLLLFLNTFQAGVKTLAVKRALNALSNSGLYLNTSSSPSLVISLGYGAIVCFTVKSGHFSLLPISLITSAQMG